MPMNKFMKVWKDPVWSKVLAYCIIGLFSLFLSAIVTYLEAPSSIKDDESIVGVLFNYSISVNIFTILTVLLFLILITIGFTYKNYFLKYDLFISAPMSGFDNDEEYKGFRQLCLNVKKELEDKCGFKNIYYAASKKPNRKSFSIPKVAFLKDLAALKSSKKFVLIHPGKMFSSTLFECGFAYRKQTKSVYFVRNLNELPFLMRHLADAASFVSIICVDNMNNIVNVINTDSNDIFKA